MNLAPDNAYRATDPKAVTASLDRYNEQASAFYEAVKAFGADLGHTVVVVGNHQRMFASYLEGEWDHQGKYGRPKDGPAWGREKVADIPPGWHYYVKDREVRPYRGGKDKASKDAVAALASLNKQSPGGLGGWLSREFGIQKGAGPFMSFGFEPVGDDYFVLIAEPRPGSFRLSGAWDGNSHFQKVPMSAYWLAKEQAGEAA